MSINQEVLYINRKKFKKDDTFADNILSRVIASILKSPKCKVIIEEIPVGSYEDEIFLGGVKTEG